MGLAKKLRDLTQAGNKEKWAAYRADNLAASLGLTLVSGDPATNFLIDMPGRYADVASGARSARRAQEALDLVMQGTYDGRAAELVWRDGGAKKWGVLVNTITYAYDARLSVACSSNQPPLEILNRDRTPAMTPTPLLDAPLQPFGNPQLDGTWDLRGGSAGIGPRLVDAVLPMTPVEWIHVLWDGEHVSYVLHPYSTFGLGQGPAILAALAAIARVLES
jgi:hypothetical protein